MGNDFVEPPPEEEPVPNNGELQPQDWEPRSQNGLEPFRDAVNQAAARVRGLWLGYIALLAYLFISVGAVTHRDLLLESPVRLPVLNVDLPLLGFFAVAPVFFLINHFYLLLQLLGLGRRIREYNDEIERSVLGEAARHRERRKLDTFVIVQLLGGGREEQEGLTGRLLGTVAVITLVLGPVLLLLTIQLQFLPYQNELITWLHRIAIGIDLALLWAFWPSIKLGDWAPLRGTKLRAAAVASVTIFSFFLATFPGELADGGLKSLDWSRPRDSDLPKSKAWLFGNVGSEPERFHLLPFSRTLDIPGDATLFELAKLDKIRDRLARNGAQSGTTRVGRTLSLRGRHLRGAIFDGVDLRNADLSHASLQSASLRGASLQDASLNHVQLQRATLKRANLQGASLRGASLQDASLGNANLQGASLGVANLQEESLQSAYDRVSLISEATLQGLSIRGASLQDASFLSANLQGASLDFANLQGASFDYAKLQGALLAGASLQGASFDFANLQGASLDYAHLQGTSFEIASLQGASLDHARLQGASLGSAWLQGASLDNAQLQGALLGSARLPGVSVRSADPDREPLWGAVLRGASMRNTLLWRAYGEPNVDNPVTVWVSKPSRLPMTAEELAVLEEEALTGVQSIEAKEEILGRIERLWKPASEVQDNLPDQYWVNLELQWNEERHRKELATLLEDEACADKAAPHVARGLILFGRLLDLGNDRLQTVAKNLLTATENESVRCHGVIGLDDIAKAQLREWAASPDADALGNTQHNVSQ